MWNINRLYCLGMGLILGSLIFQTSAFAQQPFSWESNLENAQRLAAQSNRLVLIHFWAPWCGACKRMEEEVFNQPAIGAALQANYVPVRINADLMPATAKQYGITALPTQVIITPQGNVVDVIRGRSDASQIVFRLNQVAAAARQEIAGQRVKCRPVFPHVRPIVRLQSSLRRITNLPMYLTFLMAVMQITSVAIHVIPSPLQQRQFPKRLSDQAPSAHRRLMRSNNQLSALI